MRATATIWGTAGGTDDISVKRHRSGTITSAHTIHQISLELPPGGVEITADHGGPQIGTMTFAELDQAGTLRCVAVVDSHVTTWDGDLYWSGEWSLYGNDLYQRSFVAETARLDGLSIVTNPASLAAGSSPLRFLDGDYRDTPHRATWPMNWAGGAPLVKRALEQCGKSGAATRIVGPPAKVQRLNERDWLVDDELAPTLSRGRGRLRIRPCRILSVS